MPAALLSSSVSSLDVLEPEHDVTAIGSGGNYALAAGRALMDGELSAEDIARRAMAIR